MPAPGSSIPKRGRTVRRGDQGSNWSSRPISKASITTKPAATRCWTFPTVRLCRRDCGKGSSSRIISFPVSLGFNICSVARRDIAGVRFSADDMGLGKTLQLLVFLAAAFERDPKLPPALIVAPVSLLENWEKEAKKFLLPEALSLLTAYGDSLLGLRVFARQHRQATSGGWLGQVP